MNKYRLILGLIMIAILFVGVSCGGGGGGRTDPIVIDTKNLVTGKDGITLSFTTKKDASEVGEDVFFLFNLNNRGAISVENGVVAVPNPYPTYLDIPTGMIDYSLEGKSMYMREGENTQEEIVAKVKGIPHEKEFIFTISAIACYPYKTKFSTNICVDATKNPENEVVKQVCYADTQTFSSGQGAPIEVTKLEQRVKKTTDVDYALEFKIYVENTGGGTVLLPDEDYRNICSRGTWTNKFNDLRASAIVSVDQELECDSAVVDKYKPNMQYYVCRGRLSDPYGANYVTTFRFELDYSYINPPMEAKLEAKVPTEDTEW